MPATAAAKAAEFSLLVEEQPAKHLVRLQHIVLVDIHQILGVFPCLPEEDDLAGHVLIGDSRRKWVETIWIGERRGNSVYISHVEPQSELRAVSMNGYTGEL